MNTGQLRSAKRCIDSAGFVILRYAPTALAIIMVALLLARCVTPREGSVDRSTDRSTGNPPAEREVVRLPDRDADRRDGDRPGASPAPNGPPFTLPAEPEVQVVLGNPDSGSTVALSCDTACSIYADGSTRRFKKLARLDVETTASGLKWAGGPTTRGTLRFAADDPSEPVRIGRLRYRGEVRISAGPDGRIRALNVLPIEDYLRGVVAHEMPRTYPRTALESQAIVARTYALASLSGARSADGLPVLMTDDVSDQVYGGVAAETAETDAAVRRTAGQGVRFNGALLVTYFHSTCAGHTSDPGRVLARPTAPPLRGVPCGYCSGSPHDRWTVDVPAEDVRRALASCGIAPTSGRWTIAPGDADEGGRLLTLRAKPPGDLAGGTSLSANAFRLAVGPGKMKSTRARSIEWHGDRLRIAGAGFGHGCGLCQNGARGLAESGRDAAAIVSHYYPGSELARIYPTTSRP